MKQACLLRVISVLGDDALIVPPTSSVTVDYITHEGYNASPLASSKPLRFDISVDECRPITNAIHALAEIMNTCEPGANAPCASGA